MNPPRTTRTLQCARSAALRETWPSPHAVGQPGDEQVEPVLEARALGTAALGTLFFHLLADQWGFGPAMQAAAWGVVGLLAATFALTFLLPLRARPDQAAH